MIEPNFIAVNPVGIGRVPASVAAAKAPSATGGVI